MAENFLYYGDNLDILRRYVEDESVDLIYLDPPFNSNQSYNVLFADKSGNQSEAQIRAFEDTWQWDQTASRAYHETVEAGGEVSRAMQAFRTVLGENDMLAYLSMMAPRLVELRRVLKPTGSIYLHCDPTASHYLKVLMDAVFGPRNFKSEVIWKRSAAHSDTKQGRKIHGHIHDVILFFANGPSWKWNPVYSPYDDDYIERFYRYVEEGTGRRYRVDNLTAARPGGDVSYEWRIKRLLGTTSWEADLDEEFRNPQTGWEYKGIPPYKGRFWAYSRENMRRFELDGRIYYTKSGMPCYKRFLDEMPGVALQDVWTDIPPIASSAAERLGYPTQKPEPLLERIIESSSDEADLILDPFCGCGTTIAAAQKLDRHWIGIDITHLAIGLIRHRLFDTFGKDIAFEVIGEPTTVGAAQELARQDPFQFQYWALGLVGARKAEQKKGADKGIDGRLYFHDNAKEGTKQIILSVKSGANVGARDVRDLRGVIDRENAQIGVLITLHNPTKPMRSDAASSGFYESPWGKHPRIQILTIADLLEGRTIDHPKGGINLTFRQAPKHRKRREQADLPMVAEPPETYD